MLQEHFEWKIQYKEIANLRRNYLSAIKKDQNTAVIKEASLPEERRLEQEEKKKR